MDARATVTAVDYVVREELQVLALSLGLLVGREDHLGGEVVGPEAITDGTKLLLLLFLVTVRAKLEILRPFIHSVLAGFPAAALHALSASVAIELYLALRWVLRELESLVAAGGFGDDVGHGKLEVRVHALVVVGGVAALANQELLRLALATGAQAVDAADTLGTTPELLSHT
jgi:hypothetical protein